MALVAVFTKSGVRRKMDLRDITDDQMANHGFVLDYLNKKFSTYGMLTGHSNEGAFVLVTREDFVAMRQLSGAEWAGMPNEL